MAGVLRIRKVSYLVIMRVISVSRKIYTQISQRLYLTADVYAAVF